MVNLASALPRISTIKAAVNGICLQVVATCSKHHTEVSLVSDYSSSLSFWSQLPPLSISSSQNISQKSDRSHQRLSQLEMNQRSGLAQQMMSQPQLPPQPPVRDVQYNPDKTYVAVVVSDGDNMQVRDC